MGFYQNKFSFKNVLHDDCLTIHEISRLELQRSISVVKLCWKLFCAGHIQVLMQLKISLPRQLPVAIYTSSTLINTI